MFTPEVEDVGINIGFDQPYAQQNPGGERPDDIDPAFGIPVMLPGAALSTRCIPIGARHVMGKTTLVDIDNGPGIALIGINLFPKPLPRVPICFRGRQGFLYVTPGLPSACHMAFDITSNRAARSYWQAAGWSITSCASFSGSIFRTFRRSRGLGAIRLTQRLIEAMPTENRSAVSPKLRHSFYRNERTCRPKGTGYVITNSIT